MSLFRVFKYSSLLFFYRRYRGRIFRVVAVLLFAAVTSLLYQDVADFLGRQYPGSLVYALVAKILIVYGALAFVLWQFRPGPSTAESTPPERPTKPATKPADRLSELEDLKSHDRLRTRYDRILDQRDN